ncbi:alpha/beta hydrolase [Mesorhizobium sp. NBSH29]|uniref:alpha/beta hydrolase n=1 Tax=Mesorhizobium sp. NBSH29 TaxID=2654249 RepID=UPI00189679E1|nr:alpha/beta hydrolase [Mesorhizobium sp. NBSH29]QPC86181.1 alpha/beta hydrolase [Mesorhizobium sp. NBSH29]
MSGQSGAMAIRSSFTALLIVATALSLAASNFAAAAEAESVALASVEPLTARKQAKGTKAMAQTPHVKAQLDGFIHEYHPSATKSALTLVLLHGSGGDEAMLLPLAREAAPGAALLAVRGRVVQDGVTRWYRRVTPVRFDQDDIRGEADAFATFMRKASAAYGLAPANTVFVGYSNGANLVAALALLHPALVQRAALLRSMPVLEKPPVAALAAADFLVVAGKDDGLYARYAPTLERLLRKNGARVEAHQIAAGHGLDRMDADLVAGWLATGQAVSMK